MAVKNSSKAGCDEQLDRDLTAYSAAAGVVLDMDADRAKARRRSMVAYSVAAAGAGLLGALDVNAAIQYTDVDWYIGNGGAATTTVKDINFAGTSNDLRLRHSGAGTTRIGLASGLGAGDRFQRTGPGLDLKRFVTDDVISNATDSWGFLFSYKTGSGFTRGYFSSSNTGYVGLKFNPGDGSALYGWVHIDSVDSQGLWYHVDDYAYQDDGTSIKAGEMPVPEPSTIALALLASGAAGVMASRRKKILKGRK